MHEANLSVPNSGTGWLYYTLSFLVVVLQLLLVNEGYYGCAAHSSSAIEEGGETEGRSASDSSCQLRFDNTPSHLHGYALAALPTSLFSRPTLCKSANRATRVASATNTAATTTTNNTNSFHPQGHCHDVDTLSRKEERETLRTRMPSRTRIEYRADHPSAEEILAVHRRHYVCYKRRRDEFVMWDVRRGRSCPSQRSQSARQQKTCDRARGRGRVHDAGVVCGQDGSREVGERSMPITNDDTGMEVKKYGTIMGGASGQPSSPSEWSGGSMSVVERMSQKRAASPSILGESEGSSPDEGGSKTGLGSHCAVASIRVERGRMGEEEERYECEWTCFLCYMGRRRPGARRIQEVETGLIERRFYSGAAGDDSKGDVGIWRWLVNLTLCEASVLFFAAGAWTLMIVLFVQTQTS